MAQTIDSKNDKQNFNDCLKPVPLSNLDNEEFYTVYGLYHGIKTYESYQSNGSNYKKDYISIFNNYYNRLDSRTISFPSMIVFCKVSTFKKDDIMYDKERDSKTTILIIIKLIKTGMIHYLINQTNLMVKMKNKHLLKLLMMG